MAHRIRITGERQVDLEEFDTEPLTSDQVRIRSHTSLLSSGTESIIYARRFEAGTHWDQWVKYPMYVGYALAGEVVEVGSAVKRIRIGQTVVSRANHASEVVTSEYEVFAVPPDVQPEAACWFALGKITAMGAKAARYEMGDSVLVIGAGPIGQMTVRWAFALGVENIIVIDPMAERLTFAEQGGATHTIDAKIDEARDTVLSANGGRLPRVVIDSTGNQHVFAAALGLVDRFGTLVVLGDTGVPSGQHLTPDVVLRGIHIVGAHDGHEVPGWDADRIYRLFFQLMQTGRLNVSGLITHRFIPSRCADAYEAAAHRTGAMGIAFHWH